MVPWWADSTVALKDASMAGYSAAHSAVWWAVLMAVMWVGQTDTSSVARWEVR